MIIIMNINTNNDAFDANGYEIKRIIREQLLTKIYTKNMQVSAKLIDINGNDCGKLIIKRS